MSPLSASTSSSVSTLSTDSIVYIVDDDPGVRFALELLTRSCGWRVLSFDSGSAFLESPLDVDRACILLDINMPKMDGEEVLRRLRARGTQLPVLVITGDQQGPRLDRVRRLGAYDVLEKPFGDAAFQQAVQACLDSVLMPVSTLAPNASA